MRSLTVMLLYLVIAVGCGDSDPEIHSDGTSSVPIDTLSVVLQIGTVLEDSTTAFWFITDAAIDEFGNILVLDRIDASLKMFNNGGEYIRNVARSGNGPGELILPWDMFMFNDGRLMVLDPGKQGFLLFDDSLRFVEELGLWQQNQPFQSCAATDSQFAAYKANYDLTETEIVIHRGVALYTYGCADCDLFFWQDSVTLSRQDARDNMSTFYNNMEEPYTICGDGQGKVFFSMRSGDEFSIHGWNVEGEEQVVISQDLIPVEKSLEEMKAESTFVTLYWAGRGNVGSRWEYHPKPMKDMVMDINIGPDGNLWARRGTSPMPFFDIFDPGSGELIRQAVFPDSAWSWKVEVSRNGILAWEEDPESGYQTLFVLDQKIVSE